MIYTTAIIFGAALFGTGLLAALDGFLLPAAVFVITGVASLCAGVRSLARP